MGVVGHQLTMGVTIKQQWVGVQLWVVVISQLWIGGHQKTIGRGHQPTFSIMQQLEIRVSICLCTSMYRKSKSTELF